MKKAGRPFGKSDFLEVEEVQKILSLPDKRSRSGLRDYMVLRMLSNTGMRKGELVKLTLENIDCDNSQIHFQSLKKRGKGKGRERAIPMDADTMETLRKYIKSEYNGESSITAMPLFRTLGKHGICTKQAITPKAVDCIVKKYAKVLGIAKRITPHSFRSTRATLLLDNGVNPATVRDLLDHEDISSTNEYFRANQLRLKEAQNSLVFA